jgi:hypothetical protein
MKHGILFVKIFIKYYNIVIFMGTFYSKQKYISNNYMSSSNNKFILVNLDKNNITNRWIPNDELYYKYNELTINIQYINKYKNILKELLEKKNRLENYIQQNKYKTIEDKINNLNDIEELSKVNIDIVKYENKIIFSYDDNIINQWEIYINELNNIIVFNNLYEFININNLYSSDHIYIYLKQLISSNSKYINIINKLNEIIDLKSIIVKCSQKNIDYYERVLQIKKFDESLFIVGCLKYNLYTNIEQFPAFNN